MCFTIVNGLILKGEDLNPQKANILIEDGKIIEISKEIAEGKIIDANNNIISPRFLNGHTHIGDSIIKDEGDGKSIEEIVKPPNGIKHKALSESSDDEIIIAMKKSIEDMFKTGTGSFIDYRESGIKGVKLLKKATKDIPIKPIILGRDNSFFYQDPDLSKVKIAIRKLLKYCDGIAPSGFGEINPEIAILIAKECEKKDKISSIHVAEYEKLQKDSIKDYGKTEIERAIDYQFNQLIHITSPLNDDLDLIANNNKNIVLCPRSNGAFFNGFPPIIDILKKGIKPLIGTDNIMINSPNMFRELEYTLKTTRAIYKTYFNPKELLKMATSNFKYFNEEHDLKLSNHIIEENSYCDLMIVKKTSKNPYLTLINRTQKEDIMMFIVRDRIFSNL